MSEFSDIFQQNAVKNSSEQPVQPAAPAVAPPTPAAPSAATPFSEEFGKTAVHNSNIPPTEPQSLPASSPQSSLLNRVLAPLVGAGKAAISIGAYGSPEMPMLSPDDPMAPARTAVEKADKYLPKPKDQVEAGLQGAGAAAINPLAMVTGPVGIVSGAVGGGVTAWREAASPGTPGWNALWGLIASIAAPSVGNIVGKAGRIAGEGISLFSRSPLVQAWKDQGITAATAAAVGKEGAMPKTVRMFRESPFSSAVNEAEEQGTQDLSRAVERQAQELGLSHTPQEAGTAMQEDLRDYTTKMKNLIGMGNSAINRGVDPATTNVPMYGAFNRLVDAIYPTAGAEKQSGGLLPRAQRYLANLMEDITKRNQITGNNDSLPLAAVKEVKRNIGDLLEESILANADTSKRQLRAIYGILADTEKTAYAGTPYEDAFNMLQATSAKFYSELEHNVAPLIDKGVTPERAYRMLLSQGRIGGTKLESVFDAVPVARDEMAGAVLRTMGRSNTGEFNPALFFRSWENLPPEAKQALFGNGSDMPKVYDQLAIIAKSQMESGLAKNFSGTSGTTQAFALFYGWMTAMAGAVELGAPKVASMAGMDIGNSLSGGLNGAMAGGLGLVSLGEGIMPRLLTNNMFVRWLATPKPLDRFSLERSLKSLMAAAPAIAGDIAPFANYAISKLAGPKVHSRDTTTPFMDGGYASYVSGGKVEANENEPPGSLLDQFMGTNVIPFKSGAGSGAGKYSGGNDLYETTSIGTPGWLSSKSGAIGNPGRPGSSTWSVDNPQVPIEGWQYPISNNNAKLSPREHQDIGDFAHGSLLGDFLGFAKGGVAHKKNNNYNPQPDTSGKDGDSDGSYAIGGSVLDEEHKLNLIERDESAYKNVMNYINDARHTAGGYFQITNTTWRSFAPPEVLDKYSKAIDAPYDVQKQVAKIILRSPNGIEHWAKYNPRLAKDLGMNTQIASVEHPNSNILEHAMGQSQEQQPTTTKLSEEATTEEQPQQDARQERTQQALAEVPWASQPAKSIIQSIWENANV